MSNAFHRRRRGGRDRSATSVRHRRALSPRGRLRARGSLLCVCLAFLALGSPRSWADETSEDSLRLEFADWEDAAGLLQDERNPCVTTTGNGQQYAAFKLFLLDDHDMLRVEDAHRYLRAILQTTVAPGVFRRSPGWIGGPSEERNSQDNYMGIVAALDLIRRRFPTDPAAAQALKILRDIESHGATHNWVFNDARPADRCLVHDENENPMAWRDVFKKLTSKKRLDELLADLRTLDPLKAMDNPDSLKPILDVLEGAGLQPNPCWLGRYLALTAALECALGQEVDVAKATAVQWLLRNPGGESDHDPLMINELLARVVQGHGGAWDEAVAAFRSEHLGDLAGLFRDYFENDQHPLARLWTKPLPGFKKTRVRRERSNLFADDGMDLVAPGLPPVRAGYYAEKLEDKRLSLFLRARGVSGAHGGHEFVLVVFRMDRRVWSEATTRGRVELSSLPAPDDKARYEVEPAKDLIVDTKGPHAVFIAAFARSPNASWKPCAIEEPVGDLDYDLIFRSPDDAGSNYLKLRVSTWAESESE